MLKLATVLFLSSIILANGCASTLPDESFESPVGDWAVKIDGPNILITAKMVILDETRATYRYRRPGRIIFVSASKEGTWEGYWVEDSGPYKCSEKKDGGETWGALIFRFNETYTSFKGEYRTCGEGKSYSWNGTRT